LGIVGLIQIAAEKPAIPAQSSTEQICAETAAAEG
jgi:hypothetical protein